MTVNYFCQMLADHVIVRIVNADWKQVDSFAARDVWYSPYRWYDISDWSFDAHAAMVRLILRR